MTAYEYGAAVTSSRNAEDSMTVVAAAAAGVAFQTRTPSHAAAATRNIRRPAIRVDVYIGTSPAG
jgi:hypothetical protein